MGENLNLSRRNNRMGAFRPRRAKKPPLISNEDVYIFDNPKMSIIPKIQDITCKLFDIINKLFFITYY